MGVITMANVSQLISGVIKFIDAEMLPALPANQRWIAGALVYAAQGKATDIIGALANNPIVSTLKLIDENGAVDIESARLAVKSSCQKHGAAEINIPMIGQFTLTEKNFDSMYNFIKAEAGNETE